MTGVRDAPEISCQQVGKRFLLLEGIAAWRLLVDRVHEAAGFEALHDISLEVPKGQLVGLLGRNGAGKSTLLRTIGGVFSPSSGVISLASGVSGMYELGVSGNEAMTGRGFAERWLSLTGIPPNEARKLIPQIQSFSELGPYFDQRVYSYSSGMKARLFFSVATAERGKIYLIDELLSVGDEHFQAKCWRRIRNMLSGGASGILATHDWSAVLKLCPTTILLDKGRIVDRGKSRDVVRHYLGLKYEEPTVARFGPAMPPTLHAATGRFLRISVPVEVWTHQTVDFGFAVESFREGVGWAHLLHHDPKPISDRPGQFIVDVEIPELPLVSGEYSLHMSLSQATGRAAGARRILDSRSWTLSNDINLVVEGPARNCVSILPAEWNVMERPQ